jgi:phospholipid-translocating ATPase
MSAVSNAQLYQNSKLEPSRNPVKKYRRRRLLRRGYGARRSIHMNDPAATLASANGIHYPTNYISTTKYTIYNFFIKNLWEQFHRVANIYFVFLGIITLTPASPVSAGP